MPNSNKYMQFQSISWITPNPDSISDLTSYLTDKQIKVSSFSSIEAWFNEQNSKSASVILIDIEVSQTTAQHINRIKTASSANIICIIDSTVSLEQKESLFSAGSCACICQPFGKNELFKLISHFMHAQKQAFDFNTQIEEASQMALLAMENSSDLGGIISFINKAMYSKHYTDLANHIFKATELDCESCLIEIKGHNQNYYFSAYKKNNSLEEIPVDKDMQQYLLSQKSSGRIVKSDNLLQINQSHLALLLDGLPFQDNNKMERLSDSLVVLSDVANRITENLATEEALQKTENERQSFLNTLSHELKTPLNSILGFSKALNAKKADKPLGNAGLTALRKIIDNSEQLNAIISTLIEISENANSKQEDHNQRINVDSLIIHLQQEFKAAATHKNLDFEVVYPEKLHFYNDETKVYNILKRLVDNAIKFTDTGKVSIRVTIDTDRQKNQFIIFNIEDTGIGIDQADHQRLFSAIGQLNTEHDRSHAGLGIGLYYSRLIAQQINATLSVASTLGEGSTFSLHLPITANAKNLLKAHDTESPDTTNVNEDNCLF